MNKLNNDYSFSRENWTYIRIQHREDIADAAKITLISCTPNSNGTNEFVFCKEFAYKKFFKKTIRLFTKFDLRVNGIINFWIEKSKLNDAIWEIRDYENKLTLGNWSCSKNIDVKKPQHSTIENKKQYSSKPIESKHVTNENKPLQQNYSSKPVEYKNLQTKIEELEKENQLLINNREQEIKNWSLKNELNIKNMILEIKDNENKNLLKTIKKLQKKPAWKKYNNESEYYRSRTVISKKRLFEEKEIVQDGIKMNWYKFETGASGTKFGPKTVICTTRHKITIGTIVWWKIHISKSSDPVCEINDEDNGIFLSAPTEPVVSDK